jgi:putative tricarboxylic transport membrane protein
LDLVNNLIIGFQGSLQQTSLFYCFIGVVIGTLVGVLPGIGTTAAMAILLPATFHAPAVASVVMLAGIYYGAMYGGSTTSILVNIPGEVASIVTCFDGYQMAREGRAGPALGIAAFGSFIAGTVAVVGVTLVALPLASFGLKFGPPEYFSLIIFGLTIIMYLTQKSFIKAIAMVAFGLVLSFVGLDAVSGEVRFSFNVDELLEGIGIIPIVVGLFGVTEVLCNFETEIGGDLFKAPIKGILPTLKDWCDSIGAIIRGTILGFFVGILPGAGHVLSSFLSYGLEKKISKHPEKFGKGAIEGVAGPESANNSAAMSGFIPLLTLGIPSNSIMALLFAAFLMHDITPGPLLISNHPEVFWGLITSMYIGNVMLLVLNLPLIGMWVQITRVPFRFLSPAVILLCTIGVYSINNSIFDLWVMIIFGVMGYVLRKCGYEPGPLVMAYVLGPIMEQSMRQSLLMSNGSFAIFLIKPISGICLALAGLSVATAFWTHWRKKRINLIEVLQEEG